MVFLLRLKGQRLVSLIAAISKTPLHVKVRALKRHTMANPIACHQRWMSTKRMHSSKVCIVAKEVIAIWAAARSTEGVNMTCSAAASTHTRSRKVSWTAALASPGELSGHGLVHTITRRTTRKVGAKAAIYPTTTECARVRPQWTKRRHNPSLYIRRLRSLNNNNLSNSWLLWSEQIKTSHVTIKRSVHGKESRT